MTCSLSAHEKSENTSISIQDVSSKHRDWGRNEFGQSSKENLKRRINTCKAYAWDVFCFGLVFNSFIFKLQNVHKVTALTEAEGKHWEGAGVSSKFGQEG